MTPFSYPPLPHEDSAIRDPLAVERTRLSNERTLLAYVRTALALVITGAGIRQFMETWAWMWIGVAVLAGGAVVLLFGFWRYYRVRQLLAAGRLPVGDDEA